MSPVDVVDCIYLQSIVPTQRKSGLFVPKFLVTDLGILTGVSLGFLARRGFLKTKLITW
jgi:hypothetical protein